MKIILLFFILVIPSSLKCSNDTEKQSVPTEQVDSTTTNIVTEEIYQDDYNQASRDAAIAIYELGYDQGIEYAEDTLASRANHKWLRDSLDMDKTIKETWQQ